MLKHFRHNVCFEASRDRLWDSEEENGDDSFDGFWRVMRCIQESPHAMLEDTALRTALSHVRERVARAHGSGINEQDTKGAIIEPVLRALGWDLEDRDEVRREYRPAGGMQRVDYALLDSMSHEPVLFVEAKALGVNLSQPQTAGQLVSYAAVAGVQWGVLTNGEEYRIYNAHAPRPLDEKLLRAVYVADTDAHEVLSWLAKRAVKAGHLDRRWAMEEEDRRLQRNAVPPLSDHAASPAQRPSSRQPAVSEEGGVGRSLYFRFWHGLLARGVVVDAELHEQTNPSNKNWQAVGRHPVAGVGFVYEAKPYGMAGGVCHIETIDVARSRQIYEHLYRHKMEIDKSVDDVLRVDWLPVERRAARVRFVVTERFALEREAEWPAIYEELIRHMIPFARVISPLLRGRF